MLKVAAPQEARLVGLQVVQPVELQVVQPGEVPLAVQPVQVQQALRVLRVLLEPQARLLVRLLVLLALLALVGSKRVIAQLLTELELLFGQHPLRPNVPHSLHLNGRSVGR